MDGLSVRGRRVVDEMVQQGQEGVDNVVTLLDNDKCHNKFLRKLYNKNMIK